MFYYEIMEAFFRKRVRYLIVGGLAVNLYGIPRVTQDIDIIISMDRENISKTNETLRELDYVPRLPVNPDDLAEQDKVKKWIEEKNLQAFSFYHRTENYKVIDIVIVHPLDFDEAYQRKTIKNVGSIEVYLASIDDLIIMKQQVSRAQDLSDIALLKKVKEWMGQEND
ncbi:MAG: DUF6036 family nucleotidyltransferase [Promethearchaeota archaeon]